MPAPPHRPPDSRTGTVEQNKGGKTDRQLKTIPVNTAHGIDASFRGTG
ncbi:hypothetical protein NXW38_15740 [Bacteroides ovatus]|nr:hypothetical protein [Bacteroides ovatus]